MHEQASVTPRNPLEIKHLENNMHGFHYKICREYMCMYVHVHYHNHVYWRDLRKLSTRVSMGVGGGVLSPAQSEKLKTHTHMHIPYSR